MSNFQQQHELLHVEYLRHETKHAQTKLSSRQEVHRRLTSELVALSTELHAMRLAVQQAHSKSTAAAREIVQKGREAVAPLWAEACASFGPLALCLPTVLLTS